MLIYMAIPVLIMGGLCVLFYMIGRYVRIGKEQGEVKALEIVKEPLSPQEPDKILILEEENKSLKETLAIKNKELGERDKAAESMTQENQKLLAQIRQESIDMMDEQREEVEETIKLKERISQLEGELAAKDAAVQPISSLCKDVLKELEEKKDILKEPEEKKDALKELEEKVERKKPEEKAKRKPLRKKR